MLKEDIDSSSDRSMHGGNSRVKASPVLPVWGHHQCGIKNEI